MSAARGDTVRVHYVGKLDDGTIFDSSEGKDPLEFRLGSGQVIAGFDEAVTGMAEGERKTITIEHVYAYGPRRDELMVEVPRGDLPPDLHPEVGEQLEMTTKEGSTFPVRVAETREHALLIDANHPLAGRDLTFDLHLLSVG